MEQTYQDSQQTLAKIACYNKVTKASEIPRPPWIDAKRLKKSKAILNKHFFCILFTHLCGLLLLVFIKPIYNTLSQSGKSSTLVSLFRRYKGTLQKIKLWYEGDVLDSNDPAYKSLMMVRQMHKSVAVSQNEDKVKDDELSLSQRDMVLTQFSFVGLIVLFPEQMGFPNDEEELNKLIYFWRCIGHMLGILDEHNLCTGNLEVVRTNCQNILEHYFVPSLTNMDQGSLTMSRQIVFTTQQYVRLLRFNSVTKFLFEVMNVANTFQLSLMETISYYAIKYGLKFIRYRFVAVLFNTLLRLTLCKLQVKWIVKRIENYLQAIDDKQS